MYRPERSPRLRKNDNVTLLLRSTIVRTVVTPAPFRRRHISSNIRFAIPAPRILGETASAKTPAARGRTELPGAHFPGDEPDDIAPGFRDQEDPVLLLAAPVMREDPAPVGRFLFLGTDVVDFDDGVEVRGHAVPNEDWFFHCHMVP